MNYGRIIDMFRHQEYGDLTPQHSVEEIVRRYWLFPNEAIYLVDYKYAQIEPLTKNFAKIIGIDEPHHNQATILYEHVHRENIHPFLRHIERLLEYGFVEAGQKWVLEKDFNLTFYKTLDNRIILKSTTILQYDSNDCVRYSVGKLLDVTGLVPFQQFAYKFTGPNSSVFSSAFHGLSEFQGILSKREIEILRLTGMGWSAPRIANSLYVSKHTIDTHRRNIIRKLEAMNSIDAYNKAVNMGLFKLS